MTTTRAFSSPIELFKESQLISKMQKCATMHASATKNQEDPLVDLEHHPIQIVASHQGSISITIKLVDPLTPFTFGF